MRTVSDWVEARQLESEFGTREQTRITLRVSTLLVERLRRVGEELELSRTACAEELLERAVDEAWDQLDMFSKLSREELLMCGYRATSESTVAAAAEAEKVEAA